MVMSMVLDVFFQMFNPQTPTGNPLDPPLLNQISYFGNSKILNVKVKRGYIWNQIRRSFVSKVC